MSIIQTFENYKEQEIPKFDDSWVTTHFEQGYEVIQTLRKIQSKLHGIGAANLYPMLSSMNWRDVVTSMQIGQVFTMSGKPLPRNIFSFDQQLTPRSTGSN